MEENEGIGRVDVLLAMHDCSLSCMICRKMLTPRSVVYTVVAVINELEQEMKEIDEKDGSSSPPSSLPCHINSPRSDDLCSR